MAEVILPPNIDIGSRQNNLKTFRSKVRAYTVIDKKSHDYFYSFGYDADVDGYMHTAELRAPYSNELMEYWTPITTEVLIYGSNHGDEKLLFVGRAREIKQEGYSINVVLQSYGWKFEQLISPAMAQELVGLSCDVVFKIILKALKIPSFTLDEKTEYFLKQFALNDNGDVVRGTEELERIPDIMDRIKNYTPTSFGKNTITNKLKEDKKGNIDQINYTLKYEEAIPAINPLKKLSNANPDIVAQSNASAAPTTTSSPTTTPTSNTYGLVNNCGGITVDEELMKVNPHMVKVNGALCVIQKWAKMILGQDKYHDKALTNAINRLNLFWDTHTYKPHRDKVTHTINSIIRGYNQNNPATQNSQFAHLKGRLRPGMIR